MSLRGLACGISLLAALAPAPAAQAQSGGPSAEEARAAADAAQKAAEDAQAELARAQAALAEAEQRAAAAQTAQAEAEAAAEAAARDPVAEAREAAKQAERRALEAEKNALEARREVLRLERKLADLEAGAAYDRTGPYLGGGASFALEVFDSRLRADDSWGFFVRAGYRVHPNLALEGRFDWVDGFDVVGSIASGEVEPWVATAGVRVFVLPGRIQPYLGFGFGAMSARLKGERFADGSRFSERETEFAFRAGAGLDVYVTPNVLLNLDGAYLMANDLLEDYSFATLGGGLEFRF